LKWKVVANYNQKVYTNLACISFIGVQPKQKSYKHSLYYEINHSWKQSSFYLIMNKGFYGSLAIIISHYNSDVLRIKMIVCC
jgi:hypothetical protein